ncbi:seven-hairpin glycosidase [Rhizopus microsporus ATCC 52813]|uniref:alpha-1,2-Mannosidase n=2 Tax=Rhizopus microsporus TaxID=58291 RepID=A0A2G4SG11_RHIZD|nr:seven-hairpin glycosidase [Rhizopus microsporus ATCC 52813]PHZ07703.1 seven-hairpin glycosidase [Rhizopus microsporus ATCC 52813]
MLLYSSSFISFAVLLTATGISAASLRKDLSSVCAASNPRAQRVKESFIYALDGYKKCSWGHDETLPVTCQFSDSRNGWGATLVDGLDTMLIMGLEDQYEESLDFLRTVDFTVSKTPSKGFETNIRYLGGLLAANDLEPNPLLVEKAVQLADAALVPLFVETKKGTKVKVPYTNMDLETGEPIPDKEINLAEFGTYTMEFTRLSQVTGDPKYEKLAMDLVRAAIEQPTKIPGLFPNTWSVDPFEPVQSSLINVAGGGDSFYEYLIKNYLLQEKKDESLFETWQDSVESMEEYMLSPTAEDPSIQFVSMISNSSVYYVSQELICFWPGNILLGASQLENHYKKRKYRKFADTFLKSCVETWLKTKTGISPESWRWTPKDKSLETKLNTLFDNTLKSAHPDESQKFKHDSQRPFTIDNAIYDLRPETIESIFYYYRLTGNQYFQDLAWKLYLAIEKYTKTKYGYTAIHNVDEAPSPLENFQESFLFAETLKYLYLIFASEDCISLDEYVFNTEAHPFKLPQPISYQL